MADLVHEHLFFLPELLRLVIDYCNLAELITLYRLHSRTRSILLQYGHDLSNQWQARPPGYRTFNTLKNAFASGLSLDTMSLEFQRLSGSYYFRVESHPAFGHSMDELVAFQATVHQLGSSSPDAHSYCQMTLEADYNSRGMIARVPKKLYKCTSRGSSYPECLDFTFEHTHPDRSLTATGRFIADITLSRQAIPIREERMRRFDEPILHNIVACVCFFLVPGSLQVIENKVERDDTSQMPVLVAFATARRRTAEEFGEDVRREIAGKSANKLGEVDVSSPCPLVRVIVSGERRPRGHFG